MARSPFTREPAASNSTLATAALGVPWESISTATENEELLTRKLSRLSPSEPSVKDAPSWRARARTDGSKITQACSGTPSFQVAGSMNTVS